MAGVNTSVNRVEGASFFTSYDMSAGEGIYAWHSGTALKK